MRNKWFFLLPFFVFSLSAKPLEIELAAPSVILMNAKTGAILYEKQARVPRYPGSITKVAAGLFALEQKKAQLDRFVTVSQEALKIKPVRGFNEAPAYWGETDGTKMGLVKGEILSLESLFHGFAFVSGNDAANVIAESLSSSIPDFVREMNEYLRSLGCMQTQFQNPHGLHHPEHFTTAYDMCLIAQHALRNSKFREIFSKVSYAKPKTNKQPAGEIRNVNALLKPGKYFYSKTICAKTGFHSHAKRTLVAAAGHENRELIAVLMGCANNDDRYGGAKKLFEAAFAEKEEKRVFFQASHVFTKELEGAKTLLQAELKSDLSISYFPAEEPVCKAFLKWEKLVLPVKKGTKVGVLQVCDEKGVVLQSGNLIAKEDVLPTWISRLKQLF